MKKRSLKLVFGIFVLVAALMLAACADNSDVTNGPTDSTPTDPPPTDPTLSPDGCTSADGHNFVDGVCQSCWQLKYAEGLAYVLNADSESYSVSGIGTSTDDVLVIPAEHEGKPVTGVADKAFYMCTQLRVVRFPDSITSIGNDAFRSCTGLTRITMSDSVTSIGWCAFMNCKNLLGIKLSNNLEHIGAQAFDDTKFYNTHSYWENGVLYLGRYLIGASSYISGNYVIKKDTKILADGAFTGCCDLESVTIRDSITVIPDGAFTLCWSLESVTIPASVVSIGKTAFRKCGSLTRIDYSGTVAQWNSISKAEGWDSDTGAYTVYCTDGIIEK